MSEDELCTLAASLDCTVQYDVEHRENRHGDAFELPVYTILHDGTKLISFYAVVVEDWLQPDEARRFLMRELERKTPKVEDVWPIMPPLSTRRVRIRIARLGKAEPLPYLDELEKGA